MKITILGSGGCTVIPRPLCQCRVCKEARRKGPPYERTGPSLFIHDENILIDTPAEISRQLNRSSIEKIEFVLFTHPDPDHIEGVRILEQITLDFRTWEAYPDKQITLILPDSLLVEVRKIRTVYGPLLDFYERSGFIRCRTFKDHVRLGLIDLTAIPVKTESQISFIYVFDRGGKRVVYAPCDIKPFPEHRHEVQLADILIIQPGIFETGLKHGFKYPEKHISRKTLYTFEETLDIAVRLQAKKVIFTHLEEYWNRSYDDYRALEAKNRRIRFAYDGMRLTV